MPVTREIIATPSAPAAIGPYSQGVVVSGGRTLYSSGQIALDPATGAIVGQGDVRAQTVRVLDNLQAVLEAAGWKTLMVDNEADAGIITGLHRGLAAILFRGEAMQKDTAAAH